MMPNITQTKEKRMHGQKWEPVIEARKERFKYGGYTSASIETNGKMQFLYYRIKIRAKSPLGKGIV